MLRHEHFEEICAAASVGQATGEELVELEQHASECGRCKQAYFNYLNVAAQQFATAKQDPTISPKAIEECIDSELFVRRFLDRAEREGITFSRDVEETVKLPAAIPFAVGPRVRIRLPPAKSLVRGAAPTSWTAHHVCAYRNLAKFGQRLSASYGWTCWPGASS